MLPVLAIDIGGPSDIAIVLFVLLLIAALTIFWIVELVDAARRQFPDILTKVVWLVVIFFTHVLGALLYYFLGKRQGALPMGTGAV